MATVRQHGDKVILELSADERHITCVALAIYGSNALTREDADTALTIAQTLSCATTITRTETPSG